jgi:type IV secretion system protein VirB10
MEKPPLLDLRPEMAAQEADTRPVVAEARWTVPWWIYASGLVLIAATLFAILESRRTARTAPTVKLTRLDEYGVPQVVTPLAVPPEPVKNDEPFEEPAIATFITPPPPAAPPAPVAPSYAPPPKPYYMPPPAPPLSNTPGRPVATSESALVLDTTTGDATTAGPGGPPGNAGAAADQSNSARASRLRNRATTVPQGAIIPIVLETALDSTRPGPARAIVSRDVLGSDGTRILIPRGSRLIGEYAADLAPGQNRALVMWTRLVRPDGAAIAIGSPSADPLGRVGIRGKVNSHFFQRFAGAVLQSSLDIGVNLASRLGNSNVVVALPGTVQNATQPLFNSANIQPTLRIKQGASVSVFVARDLDFSAVEADR